MPYVPSRDMANGSPLGAIPAGSLWAAVRLTAARSNVDGGLAAMMLGLIGAPGGAPALSRNSAWTSMPSVVISKDRRRQI